MITLDCGIKSVEMITYAQSLGIDVIVCDHHLPDTHIPPAFAILNPKQVDCKYPYKELSGCGIGFKLASALAIEWKLPMESVYQYLDLVATSIAADIVPIDGENRILAYYGIKRINESPCLAISTLKELGGVQKALSISDLVFGGSGPRVEMPQGRMDDAPQQEGGSYLKRRSIVKQLSACCSPALDNDDRKEVDKSITEEAIAIMNDDPEIANRKTAINGALTSRTGYIAA